MDFELYSLLSTIILLVTVLTVAFAIFSYTLFRYRQIRQSEAAPPPNLTSRSAKPRFFKKYEPGRSA